MKAVPNLNLQIPDHTILDKIGEGGMSAIYLARQTSLQRKVAIKVLKKLVMEDRSLAERFVEEAKMVASLDHPHIISIYEAKKLPSGLAYFTMPYLTHGDFSEIICTNSEHLIELLCQICDGLSHAHKHGIVHRDLKPDNILFDQFGRIKIADFGIAISKNNKRQTKESQLLGSAHYMSPEQIQSREVDNQSDIYSLGCIIYEKLTGDHLFHASNDFSILMSHINKPIPELPVVLQEWQPIIEKCLAKNPKDRYQDIETVKSALLEIKNSTQPAVNIEKQPNIARVKTTRSKYLLGATILGLTLILVLGIFINNQLQKSVVLKEQENAALLSAEQQAAEIRQAEMEQAKALKLEKFLEAKNSRAEEEVINLSDSLDNETINQNSVEAKLNEAQQLLKRNRLTKPKGDNAADKFHAILLEQPNNQTAKNGLNQVGLIYFKLIDRKLSENNFDDAKTYVQSLAEYFDEYQVDQAIFDEQISAIVTQTRQLVTQATSNRRKNSLTEQYLVFSALLKPDYALVNDLQLSYNNIPRSGDLTSDNLGHEFMYFAVNNVPNVSDFMFGTNEISIEQFTRFAQERFTDLKCSHYDKTPFFKKTWIKPPFDQSPQHPVICISAANAQAYASWLSDQTGYSYRLPTAAEFTYINQQNNSSANCLNNNQAGTETSDEKKATNQRLSCNDNHVFTAPIQALKANNGINNLNGNVSEWVTNCDSKPICATGNSWRSGRNVQNTQPLQVIAENTYSHIGFRLIREL